MRNACLSNLRQINQLLNCCLPMENKLKPGDPIDPRRLPDYLSRRVLPCCPSGAAYSIPYVAGGRAVCPKHGDLLASARGIEVYGPKPIYPAGFAHN